MMGNNPNLDLGSINAYTIVGKILSFFQDIERQPNDDGRNAEVTDRMLDNPNPGDPHFFKAGQ